MFRWATGSLCVVLAAVNLAAAPPRPEVAALRNQINGLKKEQDFTVKAIQARYRAIRQRDRLTQQQLRQERAEVRRQEEVAVALASSPAERELVRQQYDALQNYLTTAVKLEAQEIRLLTDQERALVQQVRNLYSGQIRRLEQQLRALERAGPGRKR